MGMHMPRSVQPLGGSGSRSQPWGAGQRQEQAGLASRERFRQQVIREADSVACLYLEGERLGQPATREQKEIIEGILAADYEGRTLVELLQNGHDAHDPSRRDGRLEFWLRQDEGDFGVLYVANGGEPLKDENFTGLCRIALSSKRPDQGIGNKGVGFKSVLQLSRAPEIYSMADAQSGQFDGYCFRFALPEDYALLAARVAPDRPGLAEELQQNVANLKIPVPLETIPDEVAEFAGRGFVTVIRLVLRSPAARERAVAQLAELASSEVPFHLFLERVSKIGLRVTGGEEPGTCRMLRRLSSSRAVSVTLSVDDVTLEDGTAYVVLRRTVAEAAMKEVIGLSRQEGGFGSGWDDWQGDAAVSVALPSGKVLPDGRLYAFLPMRQRAPFAAFVNAPFYGDLSRRSIERTVPLNEMLIREAAALCADAAILAARGELDLPDELLLDVVTWDREDLHLLASAIADLGENLAGLPVLPPAIADQDRVPAAGARLWHSKGKVFGAAAAAAAGVRGLIAADLGSERNRRLLDLGRFLRISLIPTDADIADYAERFAAMLGAGKEQDFDIWAQFYDDLSVVMTDGRELRNRRILIDARGSLVEATDGTDGTPTVFVAGTQADDDLTVAPPVAVSRRVVFTASDIPWRGANRTGRDWLERQGLVREYRTEPVLALVGEVMRDPATTDDDRASCLQFAYALWRGAQRPISQEALSRSRLMLPAISGWVLASTAHFGPGWGGPHEDTDKILERLLSRASSTSAELSAVADSILLPPDDVLDASQDSSLRRRFAEQLGARHGLDPIWEKAQAFHLTGYQIAHPQAASSVPANVGPRTRQAWLALARRWERQAPSYSNVSYAPTTNIARLPGQEDTDSFDPEARRLYADLILRGLSVWPDTAIHYTYARATDPARPTWPTLLAAFLASAPWIPQTAPRERSSVGYENCSSAWWLREAETPGYLPAPPPSLRSLATPQVLAVLEKVGVRFWDDPRTAADRLRYLTGLIADGAEHWGNLIYAIRKAYEAAWRDLLDCGGDPPNQVLVLQRGRLLVADISAEETIYVADPGGATKERLLAQAPVQVLAIRDPGLAARVHQQLDPDGTSALRSISDAEVTVMADGGKADDVPGQELKHFGSNWLPLLLLAILEWQYNGFPAIQPAQLADTARLLDQLIVVTATTLTTTVDGHQIHQEDWPSSVLVGTENSPRVIVAAPAGADRWTVLEAASPAMLDLVGVPALTANLQLALIKLERSCGGADPGMADLASALNIPVHEVTSLAADQGLWRSNLSNLIAILACLDADTAEQFRADAGGLGDPAAVRDWLAARIPSRQPEALIALANRDDLRGALGALGIPLQTANHGLRALGLQPLHNVVGQAQQLSAYLQQTRAERQNGIRDRFAVTHKRGEPLTKYLALLGTEPAPDPAWLDRYWDLDQEVIAGHVQSWLDQACPTPAETGELKVLPPIDQLREVGTRTITAVLANARVLVDAWLYRNHAGQGARPGGRATVTEAMIREGLLDFGRITAADVIGWLHRNNQWPKDMDRTTSRSDLQLTEKELEQARARLEHDRDQSRRSETFVQYGNRTYSGELDDLQALLDAARQNVPDAILATPVEPLVLPVVPAVSGAGPSARSSSSGGGWSWGSNPPKEKLIAIGLAGEAAVGEWLQRQFGLPLEDTWASGYRKEILADGRGDDRNGYDFIVKTSDKTWLFEVKATSDDRPEIALGESEVKRAGNLSEDEEYVIVLVTYALSPERRRIHPLPNPLAVGGLRSYQIVGRTLRLRFELPKE